jgi:hypothetical protein
MPVLVCLKPWKHFESSPKYEGLIPNVKIWKGISYPLLKRIMDSILVVEDYTLYRKINFRVIEDLVTTRARVDRIFTVITGHRIKMEMPASLDVEIAVDSQGKHFCQFREGKKTTPWLDIEADSNQIPFDKMQQVLQWLYNPLKGEEKGSVGRPVKQDSLRQKILEMKQANIRNVYIALKLNKSLNYVNVTVWQLKKAGKL